MPVEAHIKQHPAWFHRFEAVWTPTVIVLDDSGKERFRLEGYLPKDEFRAQLELALGRVAFVNKRWQDAERWYDDVARNYASTTAAPEAIYWRAVTHYKATGDHTVLGKVPAELKQYSGSEWQLKSVPWAG